MEYVEQLMHTLQTIEQTKNFLQRRCATGLAGQSMTLFEDLASLMELVKTQYGHTDYIPRYLPKYDKSTDVMEVLEYLNQIEDWAAEVRRRIERRKLRRQLAVRSPLERAEEEGNPFAQQARQMAQMAKMGAPYSRAAQPLPPSEDSDSALRRAERSEAVTVDFSSAASAPAPGDLTPEQISALPQSQQVKYFYDLRRRQAMEEEQKRPEPESVKVTIAPPPEEYIPHEEAVALIADAADKMITSTSHNVLENRLHERLGRRRSPADGDAPALDETMSQPPAGASSPARETAYRTGERAMYRSMRGNQDDSKPHPMRRSTDRRPEAASASGENMEGSMRTVNLEHSSGATPMSRPQRPARRTSDADTAAATSSPTERPQRPRRTSDADTAAATSSPTERPQRPARRTSDVDTVAAMPSPTERPQRPARRTSDVDTSAATSSPTERPQRPRRTSDADTAAATPSPTERPQRPARRTSDVDTSAATPSPTERPQRPRRTSSSATAEERPSINMVISDNTPLTADKPAPAAANPSIEEALPAVGGMMWETDHKFMNLLQQVRQADAKETTRLLIERFHQLESRYQMVIGDTLQKHPRMGAFSPKEQQYQAFEQRANSLCNETSNWKELYHRLGDMRSKAVLLAILDNWYNFNIRDTANIRDKMFLPYLDLDVLGVHENEVLVDCGAYVGDVCAGFVKCVDQYRHIFAFEPDSASFSQLQTRLSALKNCTLIQKAVLDHQSGTMMSRGTQPSMNYCSPDGEFPVPSTSLDEEVTQTISILKISVCGNEPEVLKGAAEHIAKEKPRLAICAEYHPDAMWQIPKQIDTICPGYRFYLRYYGGNMVPSQYVLYGVHKG